MSPASAAQPERVSVLPEATAFGAGPRGSHAGDAGLGPELRRAWAQPRCSARQEQHRGAAADVRPLRGHPGTCSAVPPGRREEADPSEHSLTWHKTRAPCQPPASSPPFLASRSAGRSLQPFFF